MNLGDAIKWKEMVKFQNNHRKKLNSAFIGITSSNAGIGSLDMQKAEYSALGSSGVGNIEITVRKRRVKQKHPGVSVNV